MEKAKTTPDIYPLTLNSLLLACNQKSSRDPVTDYDESEVEDALDLLREKHLAMRVDMAGSRTPKFRENVTGTWELAREEYALLTTLLLRGPQTPGQLRQRSERLFPFAELAQVTEWLQRMQAREEELHALVQSLGRLTGTKEIRYAHTLCPFSEPVADGNPAHTEGDRPGSVLQPGKSRVDTLEENLRDLKERVEHLEDLLNELTS